MKKLLIIGSYYTELEIVMKARELGLWTIVTDNHHDPFQTPAKYAADEYWDISWTDIDTLEKKCKSERINGVIGGFSERRVESMIRLCERLHLPCSITMEQLDVTRDKIKFKQACRNNNLPCVPEFDYDDNICYPVIVKPVDRAGSIGINVAYDRDALERDYAYAMSLSESKQVIIEEYINNGVKFDVYYYVQDGRIIYLGSSDTIMCKGKDGAEILQKAWTFPSKYEEQFLKEQDGNARSLINSLKINNCYLTLSAFYRNSQFYFFEAGFRLSGEMSYNYYEAISGIDYVSVIIRHALGECEPYRLREVSNHDKMSVILNFYGRNGIVGTINGRAEIESMLAVIDFLLYTQIGDQVQNDTRVFKKIAMCTLCSDNKEELKDAIRKVNQSLCINDILGKDMIYERITEEELQTI